ncbi:hypothetical protein DV736_g2317, partial [Chaetothyriales sp. CBS 134916]
MPQSQADRPPRWVRRLEHLSSHATATTTPALDTNPDIVDLKVLERLRNLENLVKELRSQLEQASEAAASSASGGSQRVNSPESTAQDHDADHQSDTSRAADTSNVREQFGRLVLQDANRSRYVSSGFWSRVTDEASRPVVLHGLKLDTGGLASDGNDSSEDDVLPEQTSSTQELLRQLSDRSGFLFRHNLGASTPELRSFHPLPSQIPSLLDVYSENVNFFMQIVHMPTLTKMVRDWRGRGMSGLTLSNEALMFSIYYAAVTSMEDDDVSFPLDSNLLLWINIREDYIDAFSGQVMANFGCSKADLSLKYRLGLEHALAKADFLHCPDIVLVQAFAIFLALARRHDSPMFVYMMTGLLVRMAQYLGLQRDGCHFNRLSPFEVEMRRKVWWSVYMLDVRASEDQGTNLTITRGSFDTKIPLNINDEDLTPESKQMPTERHGITDVSFTRIFARITDIMAQMMAQTARDGKAGLEDQSRLLNEIYNGFEQEYFQYATESGNIAYWVAVTIAKITIAKMTLIVSLPILFSSSEDVSDELRTKLLVSSIEVAEYNHALNAEQACRHWRWVYQSYSHWEAVVYLMIEVSRRPWSPIVERAWVALHSSWLIPARTSTDKNLCIWIPLRKLMHKSGRHRAAEINRLRADPQAAARLEIEDQRFPSPSSSGPYPRTSNVEDLFRDRWRHLVIIPAKGGPGDGTHMPGIPVGLSLPDHPSSTPHTTTDHTTQLTTAESSYLSDNAATTKPSSSLSAVSDTLFHTTDSINPDLEQDAIGEYSNMDFLLASNGNGDEVEEDDVAFNWFNWIESAKGMME